MNGDSDLLENDDNVFSIVEERSSNNSNNSSSINHQKSNKLTIESVAGNKEVVKNKLLDFINNSNKQICICNDSKSSFFLYTDKSIIQALKSFHEGGGIIKYITEVNEDNASQSKDIIQFCDLRHLDNINGNLATNDKDEYLTIITYQDKDYNIIYSNSKEFHDKQQQVFEVYWNKAIDGSIKIKDLEVESKKGRINQNKEDKQQQQQGKTIVTQISSNSIDKTTKERLNQLIRNSRWINICCNIEWISIIQQEVYDNILEMIDTFADRNKEEDIKLHYNYNYNDDIFKDNGRMDGDINKGNDNNDDDGNKYYNISNKSYINKICWLSPITTRNREQVKQHLDKGIKIRNIDNIPINFIVTDIHCIFAIENFDIQREGFQIFFSDDEIYVKHFNELFKKLWKVGQDAADKMKQNNELDVKVKRHHREIQQQPQTEEPEEGPKNDNNTSSNMKYNQSKEQIISNKKPDREITEIIHNSEEFAKKMLKMTEKTRHDVMLVLASSNAFNQSLNFGAFDIFNRLAKEKSTNIRILLSTPLSPESNVELDEKQKEKEGKEVDRIKNYIKNSMPEVKFELIDKKNYYKEAEGMSILIIDHAEVLA